MQKADRFLAASLIVVALLASLKWHHMNLEHAYRMEMLRTATVKANEVELPQFVMTKGARR